MDTNSQHIFFDFKLSKSLTDDHVSIVKELIYKHFKVVNVCKHEFEPQGETIVFVLSESHFTLHTYPEHNYMSMDIYICNEKIDLFAVLEELKSLIPIQSSNIEYMKRGSINSYNHNYNKHIIYILTFITAFCSIIYEFLMAETLSSIMGNTILRYNITIGMFVASMGIGSLFYHKMIKTKNEIDHFISLELLLSLIGFLSPVLCLIFDYANRNMFGNNYFLSYIFNHILIIGIGFISGMEIPLLIKIIQKIIPNGGLGKILFFDYLGCVIGSLFFPFYMLIHFNIFQIGAIIAIINLLMSIFSIIYFNTKKYKQLVFGSSFCVLILILIFLNYDQGLITAFYVK
jgi:S-adenosylmethionine/arginine decarboxylase-like enzyme